MPVISMGGINSGLPANLVDQLMAAERIPLRTMEQKKVGIDAQLKLVDDFESRIRKMKSSLDGMFGIGGFKDYSLKMNQEGIVSGSLTAETAMPGNWEIRVLDLPKQAATMTNGFPDKNETLVGVGYIRFDTPDGQKEVYINDSNNTLQGVAQAINRSKVGVRASIVNDAIDKEDSYKLILSSTGESVNKAVEFPTVYLLDGEQDFYFDEKVEGQTGRILVDGFEVNVDRKRIEDLIPGVTLDLVGKDPNKAITIEVSEDYEAITGKIDGFVEALKGVLSFVQSQSRVDANTDTTKTLGGDSVLRSVEGRLRNLLQGSYVAKKKPGEIQRLAELGIEYNRSGNIDFKREKFDAALKANPKGVTEFLRGDGSRGAGFIGKVNSFVDQLTQNFGAISNKKSGLRTRIDRIDRNIVNKERRLEKKEQILRRKFTRMEETLGKLKGQGNALGQVGAGG